MVLAFGWKWELASDTTAHIDVHPTPVYSFPLNPMAIVPNTNMNIHTAENTSHMHARRSTAACRRWFVVCIAAAANHG